LSLPSFKLLRPRTIEDAVGHLGQHAGNIRILAGGTDLIPSMRQKLFEPENVLDLRGIAGLRGIKPLPDRAVEIGALTTLRAIERSDFLHEYYPVLTEAAATVASPVLRNMGTIGGNICLDTRCLWYNQSLAWRKGCGFCIKKDGDLCHVAPGGSKCWAAFSGDTPPALLCLNAEIEIASPAGIRRVALTDFYTGLGDDYRKLRVRGSIDYPLAGVAVVIKRTSNGNGTHVSDAHIGITAVNPAPLLVKGASELLAGQILNEELAAAAGDLAARAAKPLTTSALTPEYRREMIRVFTKRAVLAAAQN